MIVKNSQSILFVFTFLLGGYALKAQQVYIETGVSSAFFKNYVNSSGENTLDLKYSKSYATFLESGFQLDIFQGKLKIAIGLGYNNFEIKTGFYAGNISIPTTYNLSYFLLKTGAIFNVVNKPKFKIQVHSHVSYDWLTSGTNSYKDVVVDLYQDNTFDKGLLRFHRGLSTEYIISDEIALYVSYNVADSFKDENSDSNVGEKYSLRTNAFSFGILFSLNAYRNQRWNRFRR